MTPAWCRTWATPSPASGRGPGVRQDSDALTLRRAWWRSIAQITAAMTVVLLLMGGVALFLVNNNQSRALDTRLAAALDEADDVGDPPLGSFLARARPGGTVEMTPGTPGPVADFLSSTVVGLRTGAHALSDRDSVDLGAVGRYRVRTALKAGGERWAIASDLVALRSSELDVLRAILLAEVAGVAGAVAAAVLLSRRSVEPLARALRLQRRFVADASHELRAPLTVLYTRAQTLAADPSTDSGSTLGKGLVGLVEDTRALGEVVEDLLASAELDRHRNRMQTVDLNDIVATVLRSTSPHGHLHGVTLTCSTDAVPGPMLVRGHPTALRRAVTALVDNAIRHTASGGRVRIGTASLGDRVELVVLDNGVGLDPARAEELFVRAHHHESDPGDDGGGGARFGLGLALVRETAEAHGGSVTAAGTPGEGARFILTLPRTTGDG